MDYDKKRVDGIPSRPNRQKISLRQAVDYTKRYRKAAPASEHAGFFWANGLREVLEQPNCSGIRVYHGLAKDGAYRLVIVGVDANGKDMTGRIAHASGKSQSGQATILDTHWPCPPFCPPGSPL
jgi:hypothetical protein